MRASHCATTNKLVDRYIEIYFMILLIVICAVSTVNQMQRSERMVIVKKKKNIELWLAHKKATSK